MRISVNVRLSIFIQDNALGQVLVLVSVLLLSRRRTSWSLVALLLLAQSFHLFFQNLRHDLCSVVG